ncbi:MAG: NADPH-dependent F420 reductase [Acidobacteria bacterium]|nr:NADPH-dependent F420 reductase [Acidobacteriota bacterium]
MGDQPIAIIGGTGDQGKGLALRWALAGCSVTIGSRDLTRARRAAEEMISTVSSHGQANPSICGAFNSEAAAAASIIVLTVPFEAQIAIFKEIRQGIKPGTLIVDVTVPLETAVGGKPARVLGVWAGSAAEQCTEMAPPGVNTVSAFHNAGAAALADLEQDVDCDIIVCGDDKNSKERLRPLVEVIPGCRYIDGGVLANSRTIEAMTAFLIGINLRYKTHSGIRITGI